MDNSKFLMVSESWVKVPNNAVYTVSAPGTLVNRDICTSTNVDNTVKTNCLGVNQSSSKCNTVLVVDSFADSGANSWKDIRDTDEKRMCMMSSIIKLLRKPSNQSRDNRAAGNLSYAVELLMVQLL